MKRTYDNYESSGSYNDRKDDYSSKSRRYNDDGKGDSYGDRKDNYGGYSAGGGSSNYHSSSGDRPMSRYSSSTSLASGASGKFDGNSMGSRLQTINWDLSKLPVFEKNFYIEHPAVRTRTDRDADEWRTSKHITVIGRGIPKVTFKKRFYSSLFVNVNFNTACDELRRGINARIRLKGGFKTRIY
jgi:ATP-dependent RNA helicase DDX5/DBP2